MRHRPSGVVATVLVLVLLLGSVGVLAGDPAHAAGVPDTRSLVVPRPPLLPRSAGVSGPRVPADALCPQWWAAAELAGWSADALRDLDVVMHRESRCEPGVWNRQDPMGGSRGLLQVNGSWTRWLRERGILTVKEDLFDPAVNLRAALAIYRYGVDRHGFGWGPWGFRRVDPYQG